MRTLASSSGVIAARYSIIADAIESSFIVNGGCNAPCERRRGAGAGPNSVEASQPIPLAKFCGNFLLQYLVSKIGPFPPGTEGIFIKSFDEYNSDDLNARTKRARRGQ